MPRPKKYRWIGVQPQARLFKPQGMPARQLEHVEIAEDELEALRLADWEGLSQEQAASAMNVSRATFGRIVAQARRKTADALIHGKVMAIGGGPVNYHPDHPCGHRRRCRGWQNQGENADAS